MRASLRGKRRGKDAGSGGAGEGVASDSVKIAAGCPEDSDGGTMHLSDCDANGLRLNEKDRQVEG